MAQLPEGMTKEQGTYSTTYLYKGVRIHKSSSGFSYRREVITHETGREWLTDAYGSYYLRNTPKSIEQDLESGIYTVDSNGALRLTEERKAELRAHQIANVTAEIEAVRNRITESLASEDYKKVQSLAEAIQNLIIRLETYQSNLQKASA